MLRLLALLSLPLWGLPFDAAAERSALDLEPEDGGSEEIGAAQAGVDEKEAKRMLESLVLHCVLSKAKDMGKVQPDTKVESCKKYKTLGELLEKQTEAEKAIADQSWGAWLVDGRPQLKFGDITECLEHSGKAWPKLDETFKACHEEKMGQLDQMVQHFALEMDQCSKGAVTTSSCAAEACGEVDGQLCPEGTACECYSETDTWRAKKWGVATWAALVSTKLTVGALLGFAGVLPGGVLVAAGTAYAFPTGDSATILSVSAAMSKVPACGCQVQPCELVGKKKCAVRPRAKSSNKYAKLPPLGFKCALERDACEMMQCGQEDMKQNKVGDWGSDVFNCNPEFLQFPNLAPGVPNTAANRNRHYHDKKFELPA